MLHRTAFPGVLRADRRSARRADFRKHVAERHREDFPYGDEERGDDRPKDESDRPEEHDPAESADEDQQIRKLGVAPDQARAQEVVDRADHEPAPETDRDARHDLSRGQQPDDRRHPHQRRPQRRHDGEDRHHRAPERGSGNPEDEEAEPGEAALQNPDHQRALDGGARNGDEAVQEPVLVLGGKRHEVENAIEDRGAADEEEEHRVQHEEQLEEEVGGAQGRRAQAVDEDAARALGQLPGQGDDALAVGQELPHHGNRQKAGFDRLDQIHVSAHPGGRRLRDVHRLRDDQSHEADGRRHQNQEHQQERNDRSRALAPAHGPREPEMKRPTHGAENGSQQDRDQELADHRQEEQRDPQRQREQEAVLESGGVGGHGAAWRKGSVIEAPVPAAEC